MASKASFSVAYAVGAVVPAVASTSMGPAVSHVPIVIGNAITGRSEACGSAEANIEFTYVHLTDNPASEKTLSARTDAAILSVRDDDNIFFSICGRHGNPV